MGECFIQEEMNTLEYKEIHKDVKTKIRITSYELKTFVIYNDSFDLGASLSRFSQGHQSSHYSSNQCKIRQRSAHNSSQMLIFPDKQLIFQKQNQQEANSRLQ